MNRPSLHLPVAILAGALVCAPAFSQETDHIAPKDVGRGDVHSPGWKQVEKLKGAPVSPRFPAVGEEIQRLVLDNGLVVYLREDRRIPLVRAEMIVKAGSYYESADQLELASFTAEQMRAGGTEKMSAQDLSDRLAFLAATLNAYAGEETARVSLDVLSEYRDEGLALFADVILRPAFDPERIQLAKRSRMFRLQHRNDSPREIQVRELNKLLYTAAHPRGRETLPPHVMALDRDALVQFHGRFYTPDRSYLAVVGDFSLEAMRTRVKELFGGWKSSDAAVPGLPELATTPRPGIYVIDRDLTQSSIAIVHWGVNRDNADRFAIRLMNDVLGGGSFSSRITERVRSDEGLAYSARSSYATDDRETGLFQATVQTKTESTVRAIRLILDEVAKMQTGKISQNEFATAKESLLYSYVFRFDDPVENVTRLMELEIDNLPPDYYAREFRGYQSVTPEQMAQAAKTYLRPADLTIFVVGKLEGFRDELAQLGEIHTIELEELQMPGPGGRPGGMRGGQRPPGGDRGERPPGGSE